MKHNHITCHLQKLFQLQIKLVILTSKQQMYMYYKQWTKVHTMDNKCKPGSLFSLFLPFSFFVFLFRFCFCFWFCFCFVSIFILIIVNATITQNKYELHHKIDHNSVNIKYNSNYQIRYLSHNNVTTEMMVLLIDAGQHIILAPPPLSVIWLKSPGLINGNDQHTNILEKIETIQCERIMFVLHDSSKCYGFQ